MIKFGLKLWSTTGRAMIGQAEKLITDGVFDYVELLAVPSSDTSVFEKVKIPYVLHIPHDKFGFNIGEKKSWELSFKILQENIKLADKISAKYLILHPGFGNMQDAKEFLKNVDDERIIIENMPVFGSRKENMIGYNLEQIEQLKKDKFGFCFDFEHATKAAMNLKTDPKKFIEKFMVLKPKVFHLCDGIYSPGPDNHLNIGEGEYDMKFFLDCIQKNDSQLVTLETPKENYKSLKQDIENLERLKNSLVKHEK